MPSVFSRFVYQWCGCGKGRYCENKAALSG
jgi:hypothetical protein